MNHNYKNNNGHNFQFTNSHLLTLSSSTAEVFQVNGQNWPVANLLVVNFHSQTREMLTPKPLTFGFSFYYYIGFLPLLRKFEPHSLSAHRFFSVLAAIIRESSNKELLLRIMKALPFIHQPDWVVPKASDMSAADWLYQHTWKNMMFFHVCCYGFSQSQKSLYNTTVYKCDKRCSQKYRYYFKSR